MPENCVQAKKPVTLSHGARLRFGALEATVLLGTEAVMAGAPTQAVNELNIEDEATDDEGGEAEDAGLRNEVTQAVPEYDEEEEEEAKGGTVAQSHDSSPATVPMKVVGEDKEGGAAAEEKPKNDGKSLVAIAYVFRVCGRVLTPCVLSQQVRKRRKKRRRGTMRRLT